MTDLNHLLHDWASRQEPTPAELDSLQARVTQRLANVGPISMPGRTSVGVRSTAANWIALVAVAASLLAAVSVFWSDPRDDSERSMDVSLASLPAGDLAARLTVVRRRPGEAKWTVVWEASVLARSEEWVRLPVELPDHSAVTMWAYSLPDGSTLVESDVALTAPVVVRVSDQQIFGALQRPARLWSARRSDGEFQLIQSVARWEAHHG